MKAKPNLPIPLYRPTISKNDLVSVLKCLVDEKIADEIVTSDFEKRLNRLIKGRNNVVAVNSASAAFYLILRSLTLKAGDEIILSPLADAWVMEVVKLFSLTPVLVDLELGSFKMSLSEMKKKISENTKVVLISHHFGYPFDLGVLTELNLAEKGVVVVEDQTVLLGTGRLENKSVKDANEAKEAKDEQDEVSVMGLSKEADAAFYCFEPHRMITTGKGGAVVCRDKKLARWIKGMRSYQEKFLDGDEEVVELDGRLDFSMNDLNAALGISEISLFDKFIKRRQEIRQYFCDVLMKSKHSFLVEDNGVVLNGYAFPVLFGEGLVTAKEIFKKYKISVAGLKEGTIYGRLPYDKDLPVINELELKLLLIPIYPTLTVKEIEKIAKVLSSIS